jgi:hypothetical protein
MTAATIVARLAFAADTPRKDDTDQLCVIKIKVREASAIGLHFQKDKNLSLRDFRLRSALELDFDCLMSIDDRDDQGSAGCARTYIRVTKIG